jgi:hypothetical protein
MTFHVAEAFDVGDQMENGPIILFWGQREFVPPPPHVAKMWPAEPRPIKWRDRRRGFRNWKVVLRLEPPEGEELDEWGSRVAAAVGVVFTPSDQRDDSHTAIFLPSGVQARNAAEALARVAPVLHALQGFEVVALQAQVEGWSK